MGLHVPSAGDAPARNHTIVDVHILVCEDEKKTVPPTVKLCKDELVQSVSLYVVFLLFT